jgi:hypothetical protein
MTRIRNTVDVLLIEMRGVDSMVACYEARNDTFRQEPAPISTVITTKLEPAPEPELAPCHVTRAGFCKPKLETAMSSFANKGWGMA